MNPKTFVYQCVRCSHIDESSMGPGEIRMATGRSISHCGTPMRLKQIKPPAPPVVTP